MEEINEAIATYKTARDEVACLIAEMSMQLEWEHRKCKPGKLATDYKVTYRFNKKLIITGFLVGLAEAKDLVRVYNPKTKKEYYIDFSSILDISK